MGIFDKIKDAIWGGKAEAAEAPVAPAPAAPRTAPAPTSSPAPAPTASPAPAAPAPTPAPTSGAVVDVAAILDAAVGKRKLKWRTSIVDLMKALGLDSSLANRTALAKELGYTGDTSKSAAMNNWLHKAVIAKLKANGGKVPADLL